MKFLFLYDSKGNTGMKNMRAFLAEYSEVDFEAELLLKDWIAEQNARKPYRKISNVQILEIQKLRMDTGISGRVKCSTFSYPEIRLLRKTGHCGLVFSESSQAV